MRDRDRVVVVISAYNEAEALPSFLAEIQNSFTAAHMPVSIVVLDDASTDGTAAAAAEFARVVRAPVNRGHGPTALAAYGEGLRDAAGVIVHVDGDGQFHGDDIVRVALALDDADADVVHGVRRGRTDPWFRRALSGLVRFAVLLLCGRSVPDVNTPLRAYRPATVSMLIQAVPEGALVPHVHFSIAEARETLRIRYVAVASIPRRALVVQGTMWGDERSRQVLPPRKLVRFAARALVELWRVNVVTMGPGSRAKVTSSPSVRD